MIYFEIYTYLYHFLLNSWGTFIYDVHTEGEGGQMQMQTIVLIGCGIVTVTRWV